jgi:hypothetical protein
MKYPDGQEVCIGDRVVLGGNAGIVVCSIDSDAYSADHPKEQWGYLAKGVMIEFEELGLIHYLEPEPDLRLRHRGTI